jgi:hypothetical protein
MDIVSSYPCSSAWYGILFSNYSATSTEGCRLCSDYGGFGCTSERHEFHAADYYAAIHFYHAVGDSLDQPPCGAERARHPGVS